MIRVPTIVDYFEEATASTNNILLNDNLSVNNMLIPD